MRRQTSNMLECKFSAVGNKHTYTYTVTWTHHEYMHISSYAFVITMRVCAISKMPWLKMEFLLWLRIRCVCRYSEYDCKEIELSPHQHEHAHTYYVYCILCSADKQSSNLLGQSVSLCLCVFSMKFKFYFRNTHTHATTVG